MEIPFFRYPHVFGQQRDKILAAVLNVMERGAFILQPEVKEFEDQIARFTGARHAIGTGNATDALELIVKAAGIGPGDEVIVPSHTFVASAASIHNNGATPVLADCGDDHLVDSASVEAAITPRTKAIMPVQLNGRVCNMDRIHAIATRHRLLVIEDSSQGLGARFKNRCAGTFGLAGVFSFYPAKVLGCFGDGGMIITNDDALAAKLRLLRDHGRGGHGGAVERWGRNSRLDTLHAAVMLVKMQNYPQEIARRRELAARYQQGLQELSELNLPPAPDASPDHFDIYQNYELQADRRDELRAHLEARGVKTIIQWGGKALHQFPALGFKADLPRTTRLFERCFLLPMNTSLTNDEVDYICAQIRGFYRR
ncbi:MAG TPA: DegT/DnrJ/EryC1/StrS family aminotransferase [Opitutaceae bacterium]|nr:DegT/DnrJ/EryC1/StrS family aminotransferase [Opitutaceae bacterium]